MTEQWRRLPSQFGPYEVSDYGQVRNLDGLILKPMVSKTNHRRVALAVSPGVSKKFQVHRLVARAFIGESDLDVLHWDDNPANNHVSNLRYGTDRENWHDSVRNGIRTLHNHCPRGHDYPTSPGGSVIRRCFTCELEVDRRNHFEKIRRGLPGDDPRHGTYAGYRAGCRCPGCQESNKTYKREWARNNAKRKKLRSQL